ncbi:hypothetical protein C8Q74DRAFT_1277539 [Fomes fomentarius]|nr:hypothetical protein C8Q74DRAFT_1277539 [Fomes fomentarius]
MAGSRTYELSSKLAKLLNVPPISIELIPGDGSEWPTTPEHAPFLFIDRNLGVPQKAAYKAYLEAVARFRSVRMRLRGVQESREAPFRTTADIDEALVSSSVILLVNPAHQSALNARKRLVRAGSLDATHELHFTSALLTLREGSKQSILWHHRRWLLRRMHPSPTPFISTPSSKDGVDTLYGVALRAEAFRAEFAAVEQACEVYPRNYHAWAHRFLCAEALVCVLRSEGEGSPSGLADVLEEEIEKTRVWIERHVSDYSAMQYHCRLRDLVRTARSEQHTSGVCDHAIDLVRVYPTHESLWLYLRDALSPSTMNLPVSIGQARAIAAQYLGTSDPQVRRCAIRCIAWALWKGKEIATTYSWELTAAGVPS